MQKNGRAVDWKKRREREGGRRTCLRAPAPPLRPFPRSQAWRATTRSVAFTLIAVQSTKHASQSNASDDESGFPKGHLHSQLNRLTRVKPKTEAEEIFRRNIRARSDDTKALSADSLAEASSADVDMFPNVPPRVRTQRDRHERAVSCDDESRVWRGTAAGGFGAGLCGRTKALPHHFHLAHANGVTLRFFISRTEHSFYSTDEGRRGQNGEKPAMKLLIDNRLLKYSLGKQHRPIMACQKKRQRSSPQWATIPHRQ